MTRRTQAANNTTSAKGYYCSCLHSRFCSLSLRPRTVFQLFLAPLHQLVELRPVSLKNSCCCCSSSDSSNRRQVPNASTDATFSLAAMGNSSPRPPPELDSSTSEPSFKALSIEAPCRVLSQLRLSNQQSPRSKAAIGFGDALPEAQSAAEICPAGAPGNSHRRCSWLAI